MMIFSLKRRLSKWLAPALAAAMFLGTPAGAQTLTIAVATAPTSMDPLFQQLNSNHELALHVYDTLVMLDESMKVKPGLAQRWQPLADPTMWEFKLRRDVKFHDGSPFTAHDVLFSYRRAMNVPGAPSTYSRALVGVDLDKSRVVDDYTLQVATKGPYPLLPRFLSGIPIVSRTLGAAVSTREFNDGSKAFGTGPYKFERYVPADRVSFVANPAYWGTKPHWQRVVFRVVTSGPTRVAALLSGDADVIASVPPADVPTLERNPNVTVTCGPSTRVIYWAMDVTREQAQHITAKDGKPIANPLRDLRVRQALSMAIDRAGMVRTVMNSMAIATNQFASEGFDGYNPAIAIPENDVARARRLLAEAGYPNGFKMTIHATNDRYVNDSQQAQAVAQMLARIGVEVTVELQPVANYFNKARAKEFTFAMVGFAMVTGETSSVVTPALLANSVNNYGGWKNDRFEAAFQRAMTTVAPAEHVRLLQEATAIAMADVPIIPTHTQVACWAGRTGLKIATAADENTFADAFTRK
jgi:peptide/nickel transport system substrate-binding protein